jgi:hypothetical protein
MSSAAIRHHPNVLSMHGCVRKFAGDVDLSDLNHVLLIWTGLMDMAAESEVSWILIWMVLSEEVGC